MTSLSTPAVDTATLHRCQKRFFTFFILVTFYVFNVFFIFPYVLSNKKR